MSKLIIFHGWILDGIEMNGTLKGFDDGPFQDI